MCIRYLRVYLLLCGYSNHVCLQGMYIKLTCRQAYSFAHYPSLLFVTSVTIFVIGKLRNVGLQCGSEY